MGWLGNEGNDINWGASPVSSPVMVLRHRGEFQLTFHLLELAGQTCPVVKRIAPLITTIQPNQSILKSYAASSRSKGTFGEKTSILH